jgi:hypothetical protein
VQNLDAAIPHCWLDEVMAVADIGILFAAHHSRGADCSDLDYAIDAPLERVELGDGLVIDEREVVRLALRNHAVPVESGI